MNYILRNNTHVVFRSSSDSESDTLALLLIIHVAVGNLISMNFFFHLENRDNDITVPHRCVVRSVGKEKYFPLLILVSLGGGPLN